MNCDGGTAETEIEIKADYYEDLELYTAQSLARFAEKNLCALSVNTYGKGKAYYMPTEPNAELIKGILKHLAEELELEKSMEVPRGVLARRIAEGQVFYVNITDKDIEIPLGNKCYGVLREQEMEDCFTLKGYKSELAVCLSK